MTREEARKWLHHWASSALGEVNLRETVKEVAQHWDAMEREATDAAAYKATALGTITDLQTRVRRLEDVILRTAERPTFKANPQDLG